MPKPWEGHRVFATAGSNPVWVTTAEIDKNKIEVSFSLGYSSAVMTLDEAELHLNQMRRIIDRQKGRASA